MTSEIGADLPRNLPNGLRVRAAIGVDNALVDITNDITRQPVRLRRGGKNGEVLQMQFTMEPADPTTYTGGGGYNIRESNKVVLVDNPEETYADGQYTRYGMFWTMDCTTTEEADAVKYDLTVADNGILFQKPEYQPSYVWPPDDGTPVVDTTSSTAITAGSNRTFTVADGKHLYGPNTYLNLEGKWVRATNTNGSNDEWVQIKSGSGTSWVADFAYDKTAGWKLTGGLDAYDLIAGGWYQDVDNGDGTYTHTYIPCLLDEFYNNTLGTSVSGSITAGTHTITTGNMTNVYKGRIMYAVNSDFSTNGEFVEVTATTSTTWTATFALPHGSNWYFLHGFPMLKDGVKRNVIRSLPHIQFKGSTETIADFMNLICEQNLDKDIDPQWYPGFNEDTADHLMPFTAKPFFYDAKDTTLSTQATLRDEITDDTNQVRYTSYSRKITGKDYWNAQTVRGANDALGYYQDTVEVARVGRIIEGPIVNDLTMPTDAACAEEAERLVNLHNFDAETITCVSKHQIDQFLFYRAFVTGFLNRYEPNLASDYDLSEVLLTFDQELATYTYQLGRRPKKFLDKSMKRRKGGEVVNEAVVSVDAQGRVTSVAAPATRTASADVNVVRTTKFYNVNTTSADRLVNLPDAGRRDGAVYSIKNIGGFHKAILTPHYGDTVDGNTDYTINIANQSVEIRSDGTTNWKIKASHGVYTGLEYAVPFSINIDGGSVAVGEVLHLPIAAIGAGIVDRVDIRSASSVTAGFDIYKSSNSTYPTLVQMNTTELALTADDHVSITDLSDWDDTTVAKGDDLRLVVASITGSTEWVSLTLWIART